MISIVRLSDSGKEKFNDWFMRVGRMGVVQGVVEAELCDKMMDRLNANESLVYELSQNYTNTGRPELITLDYSNLDVEEIADE